MIARRAWPALLALLALAGCRAAGFNNGLAPEPIAPKAPSVAAEIIERSNANAARVTSLESPATVNLNGKFSAVAHGDVALERPRNFRMVLGSLSRSAEADVGSNADEFWFWSARDKDKAVYVCDYGEGGEAPLAAAMQPDWIIEAMGLRTILPEEAADATVRELPDGTTLLTIRRHGVQPGESLVKETILETATGLVKEHRLKSSGKGPTPTLMASARILERKTFSTPGEDGAPESVVVPTKISLVWYQPQSMKMDVTLSRPILNPKFDEGRRVELFSEPAMPGYARRNLRDNTAMAAEGPSTRKSRSIPPSPSAARPGFADGNGVELGDPEPETGDLPSVSSPPRPAPKAVVPRPAPADDLLPPLGARRPLSADAVVGARMPTAPTSY